MESISVFEIIKVGIGPSSSHTMGPWNAASAFIRIIKRERSIEEVKEVFLEFFGSLAKTGIGHGTDIAGMLGLNGEDFTTINTSKIDEKIEKIKRDQIINLGGEKEIPFIYGYHLVLNMQKSLDFHPNGMIFKAVFEDGTELVQDFYSVGGGFIASQEKNSIQKHCVRTLYPCHHGSDIIKYCEKLGFERFSDLILVNEESWRSQEETRKEALNIWTPENETDNPSFSSTSTNFINSSRYVYDASYIKLKNLSLTYRVPAGLLNKVKLRNLELYVSGQNIFTITSFPGYDPEITNATNAITQGLEMGVIPNPRTYTFGLRTGF